MRSTSFVAVALCAFASTVYSAPAPQLGLTNVLGSITNPGAGNDNKFEGIGNGNGVSSPTTPFLKPTLIHPTEQQRQRQLRRKQQRQQQRGR
jgi:hypothetical protein